MKLTEAKSEFIQAWGALGSSWGINRTMSQIHALLLATGEPMTTEMIMEALKISRGNAHMNLRGLMEWQLVQKHLVPGERKEYFKAGRNVEEIARKIAAGRKKRELDPIVETLSRLQKMDDGSADAKEFSKLLSDLHNYTSTIRGVLERFVESDSSWFFKTILKMMGKR